MNDLTTMKSNICRILLLALFLASFCEVEAKNHDFKVDGLYYKIIADSKVEVTYEKKDSEKNYKNFSAVIIPGQVEYKGREYSVVKIGEDAFRKSQITSVTLPEGIKEIDTNAFNSCRHLQSVSLPRDLEILGARAFCACTALNSISLPESTITIGNEAFKFCHKLQDVRLPSELTAIKSGIFQYASITMLIISNIYRLQCTNSVLW